MTTLINKGSGIWHVQSDGCIYILHETDTHPTPMLDDFQNDPIKLASFGELLEEYGWAAYYHYNELEIPTPTIDEPVILAPVAYSGSFDDLTNKPTIPDVQIQSDWSQGNVEPLDYIKNKPTTKRQETYSGSTNSSGEYTVTFRTAYSVAPNIVASLKTSAINQFIYVTNISTTGFTVRVVQRATLSILGLEVLAGSPTNVNGANVDVLITEK